MKLVCQKKLDISSFVDISIHFIFFPPLLQSAKVFILLIYNLLRVGLAVPNNNPVKTPSCLLIWSDPALLVHKYFWREREKMKKAEIEKRKWMPLKVRDNFLKVSFVIFCPRRWDSNPRPWVNEASDLPLCLLPSMAKKKQLECFLKI